MSDDEITYGTARENAEYVGDLIERLRRLGYEAIPRPQYEALVAAKDALHDLIVGPDKKGCISRGRDALAALRRHS